MGVHRVDQVAARKAPVPGPLPNPDEIIEIRPRPRPASGPRRFARLPERWLRSVRRFLHTRRGKWVLITFACVAVLLVGLLAEGFLSSAAPKANVAGGDYDSSSALPSAAAPSPSAAKKHAKASGSGPVSDPVAALRAKFPDNPLNHLRGAGFHHVTVSVSGGEVYVLGYLIPTGMGSTYGEVEGHPRHWSMSERALGPGYLAAIFVQATKEGQPVTCRVTVDGKSTDTETTSGSYGRAICLG